MIFALFKGELFVFSVLLLNFIFYLIFLFNIIVIPIPFLAGFRRKPAPCSSADGQRGGLEYDDFSFYHLKISFPGKSAIL